MDDFQDGAPSTGEQQQGTQPSPEGQYGAGVVPAGQYNQPVPQQPVPQQPRQESALEQKERRLREVQARKLEIERINYREGRDVTVAEQQEWQRLDREEQIIDRELLRLEREETQRARQQVEQQLTVQNLEQAKLERYHRMMQPRIQAFNISKEEKGRLYQTGLQLFRSSRAYPVVQTEEDCDELIEATFNNLVVNHDAPKQRNLGANSGQGGGRTDERYNDIDSPQEEGPKDRFSHMPEREANLMRARYGSRPVPN